MVRKLFRRILWLLVLVSVAGTISAQSLQLPTYTQARQRTILWTVIGVVGAGLTVFGLARTFNQPTADYDDPDSGPSVNRILFDSFLVGSGVGLVSAGIYYGTTNYYMMQSASRLDTGPSQDSSDPVLEDPIDEEEPYLRRVVEQPYEEVNDAFLRGTLTTESTDVVGTPLIFHAARANRDASVYRLFIEHGVPPDILDRHGRNLLYYVLDRNERAEVEYLLDHNVSPLHKDDNDWTPLEHALMKRDWHLMEPLLQHLLDTRTIAVLADIASDTKKEIWTLIVETPAARETAGRLVQYGVPLVVPEPDYLTRRGEERMFARDYLRDAINNRFPVPVILAFLDAGYYDLSRVVMRNHPLFQMIDAGYRWDEIVLFLERSGSLPARGETGETILHVLSGRADRETDQLVDSLIDAGANLEARTREGDTPLIRAVRNDYPDYVRALLRNGSNIGARDQYGQTALHRAARHSRDGNMLAVLKEYGADPRAGDEDGWQPLHVAAYWGNTVAAEKLLEAGAPIDATTIRGTPAYHFSRDASTVQVFLERGVDPAITDTTGSTILHIAMGRYPSPELIRHLLGLGLDPNHRNDDGATPLFLATIFEHIDPRVGLLLLDAGADPSIENENGLTPWDMIEVNESLRNTDFYWALNDLRYDEP